jgi:S-adenosylmethionine synthetase
MNDTTFAITPPLTVHPDAREVEAVERKGRGHPDSISDALAEAFSIGLTRAYVERCGAVLHHNVDKVLLAGGASRPCFGGGEVIAPLDIYLAGRATHQYEGVTIPVSEIAEATARRWLRANLHALNAADHVRLHTVVHPGSTELAALVGRGGRSTRSAANDTSFAVGYAPASRLERVVLAVEGALTSPATIGAHPMIGEDVKVMGIRRGRRIDLTVACAIVGRHVRDAAGYREATALVARTAEDAARRVTDDEIRAAANTADDMEAGRIYLTVTGTSAEAGDDGEAGRGNRVGGLITPFRPMTLEAAAGKNVAAHVGKSYSIVAHRIARDLVERHPEVAEANCVLVSRIGWPVECPQLVELQIRLRDGAPPESLRAKAEAIAREHLDAIPDLASLVLAQGRVEAPAGWPGVLLF